MQITQYSCDYNNLAPEGCTQYFFGDKSTSGVVKTFNFDTGTHLADQNQNICVRRERGICKYVFNRQNYSHPPNNRAADLINFSGKKHPTYTFNVVKSIDLKCYLLPTVYYLGPTRLHFRQVRVLKSSHRVISLKLDKPRTPDIGLLDFSG